MLGRIKEIFTKKQFYEADLNHIVGRFESSAFRYNYTASDFLRLAGNTYNRNADVREAVNKITTTCLSFPLCVKEKNQNISELPELVKLFINKPMATDYGWRQFIKATFIQYYISGEIFLLDHRTTNTRSTDKTSLFLVWPSEISKVKYMAGVPYSFTVSAAFFKRHGINNSGPNIYVAEWKNGIYNCDISYSRNINPISTNRGLSPIISLLDDVEILVKGKKWNRSVLHNEGRPSGVFFYPAGSSKAINPQGGKFVGKNKVEEEIKQNYSGSGNAGKSLFLRGGLQFKEVTYKMKDVDFMQGLKLSRESIANGLGIPLQLFGSLERSSYNNVTEARQAFHHDTCLPLMESFLEFLSKSVFYKHGILKEGQLLSVDRDRTDIANTLRLEKMKEYDKIHFMTINEKREACGLEKVTDENAEAILVPTNLSPVDELGLGADNIDEGEGDDEDDLDDGDGGGGDEKDDGKEDDDKNKKKDDK